MVMTPEQLSELKVRNLSFIRDHIPGLFRMLSEYSPVRRRLNINDADGSYQLVDQETGQILQDQCQMSAKAEVEHFLASCHQHNRLITVAPAFANSFVIPRFSMKKLAEVVDNSPLERRNFRFYPFNQEIPLLLMMGFGTGFHIADVLRRVDVKHLVIAESDVDELFSSLFCIDWADTFGSYFDRPDKSLAIIITPKTNKEMTFSYIWNDLVKKPPFFPMGTVFYNHRGTNRNESILKRIRKDMNVYFSLWGNYDDEINQLNNGLHNFRSGVQRLRRPMETQTRTPVLLIGSGPSIDERIDWIKSVRDRAVVVACGSARDVMRRNGIVPDFQVELESDYVCAEVYSRAVVKEDNDGIMLLAAAQVSPRIFALFEEKQLYFKDSTAMASLFSENNTVRGCTPSATNAGLGVFTHLGFENLFLFGMDFGYLDPKRHHSQDSLYYTDEKSKHLVDTNWGDLENGIPVESVTGSMIRTIPFLYTGKRRAEIDIMTVKARRTLTVFNCSGGARIDGAEWLSDITAFTEQIDAIGGDKAASVAEVKMAGLPVSEFEMTQNLDMLEEAIQRIVARVKSELTLLDETSFESLSSCMWQISQFIEQEVYTKLKTLYYLFRGSLWFFLSVGYSHAYALEGEQRTELIRLWKQVFESFLDEWPEHYRSVVHREIAPEEDPMLSKRITEEVEGFRV